MLFMKTYKIITRYTLPKDAGHTDAQIGDNQDTLFQKRKDVEKEVSRLNRQYRKQTIDGVRIRARFEIMKLL
jgi:hypothetical protein